MLNDHTPAAPLKLLVIITLAWLLGTASAVQAAPQGGPTTLIITHRCAPANRAAFRESIEKTDFARFEQWKSVQQNPGAAQRRVSRPARQTTRSGRAEHFDYGHAR